MCLNVQQKFLLDRLYLIVYNNIFTNYKIMTCGIYKLVFSNTEKVYIGQSLNIEARFNKHLFSLRSGTSTPKLMSAYKNFGEPSLEIILEVSSPQDLLAAELEAIEIYNSLVNGFNSVLTSPPIFVGESNPNSKCSNSALLDALYLLVEGNMTKREVSELTGVSLYTLRHVCALESHGWIEDSDPHLYGKLKEYKNNNRFGRNKMYKIVNPVGDTFIFDNITKFCKDKGLSQPKISEVLNGKRLHHKGWKIPCILHKVDA